MDFVDIEIDFEKVRASAAALGAPDEIHANVYEQFSWSKLEDAANNFPFGQSNLVPNQKDLDEIFETSQLPPDPKSSMKPILKENKPTIPAIVGTKKLKTRFDFPRPKLPAAIVHNNHPILRNAPTPLLGDFRTAAEERLILEMKKNGGVVPKCRPMGLSRQSALATIIETEQDVFPENNGHNILNDERFRTFDKKIMEELLHDTLLKSDSKIDWNSVCGLEYAKKVLYECVIFPIKRPDLAKGLRAPPRGVLLFGPPGTGKTLICKCMASQADANFFAVSSSIITSKWVGEGEKRIRYLFTLASVMEPSILFIDEVDALLSTRSSSEHESTRRIKTEFLSMLDGIDTNNENRFLVIGATNRPQDLDEAARRRFTRRIYVPLPDEKTRQQMLRKKLEGERHSLTEEDFIELTRLTSGFSGADVQTLAQEAARVPLRRYKGIDMTTIKEEDLVIEKECFLKALKRTKASVSGKDLDQYMEWDKEFGSGIDNEDDSD